MKKNIAYKRKWGKTEKLKAYYLKDLINCYLYTKRILK